MAKRWTPESEVEIKSKADQYKLAGELFEKEKELTGQYQAFLREVSDYFRRAKLDDKAFPIWKSAYCKEIAKQINISVSYKEYGCIITVPVLLPHRKSVKDLWYADALLNELRSNKSPEFVKLISNNAIVVFTQYYPEAFRVRDNDNVEYKRVVDLLQIEGYILSDFGGYLSQIRRSKIIEKGEAYTEIVITNDELLKQNIDTIMG